MGGFKNILLIDRRDHTSIALKMWPDIAPITIPKNSICRGFPSYDFEVSPSHMLFFSSGKTTGLAEAQDLCDLKGVKPDVSTQGVTYFRILLNSHEIIRTLACGVESLYLTPNTMANFSKDLRNEIFGLLPEVKFQLRHNKNLATASQRFRYDQLEKSWVF